MFKPTWKEERFTWIRVQHAGFIYGRASQRILGDVNKAPTTSATSLNKSYYLAGDVDEASLPQFVASLTFGNVPLPAALVALAEYSVHHPAFLPAIGKIAFHDPPADPSHPSPFGRFSSDTRAYTAREQIPFRIGKTSPRVPQRLPSSFHFLDDVALGFEEYSADLLVDREDYKSVQFRETRIYH